MTESEADDVELIRRLRHGDAVAAQLLYERHERMLLRFAVAMTHCRQTAEDVVHDTFLELLQRPTGFDAQRGNLVGYLLGIARNRIARVFRRGRRIRIMTPEELVELDAESAAADTAERAKEVEQLRAAILQLPVVHREIIVLCDLEELPYALVANILDCPVGTVRSRLHRARALLAARWKTATAVMAPQSPAADVDAALEEKKRDAGSGLDQTDVSGLQLSFRSNL